MRISPLRKIVSRERNEPTATDLRGLGDEPVLKESSPYSCLSIQGAEPSSEKFNSILRKYDLVADGSTHSSVHHLHRRHLADGSHKVQAISMFLAAIELHRHFPQSKIFLHEVSRLHLRLQEGLGTKDSHQHPDHKMKEWLKHSHSMSMDATTVRHLTQSGFELSQTESTLHWSSEQVELMHIKLSQDTEQMQLRKAA